MQKEMIFVNENITIFSINFKGSEIILADLKKYPDFEMGKHGEKYIKKNNIGGEVYFELDVYDKDYDILHIRDKDTFDIREDLEGEHSQLFFNYDYASIYWHGFPGAKEALQKYLFHKGGK